MKKFLDWLVFSSENADKWSLTIKGIAVSVVPIVISVSNLAHLQLQSGQLTSLFDGVASIVSALGVLVSSVIVVIGFVRKIIATITGDNAVINITQ